MLTCLSFEGSSSQPICWILLPCIVRNFSRLRKHWRMSSSLAASLLPAAGPSGFLVSVALPPAVSLCRETLSLYDPGCSAVQRNNLAHLNENNKNTHDTTNLVLLNERYQKTNTIPVNLSATLQPLWH
jgi:hypothetical protein